MKTIIVYSENMPTVLHRVIAPFTQSKVNIESLYVREIEKGISKFEIKAIVNDKIALRITNKIKKIIEVFGVEFEGEKE